MSEARARQIIEELLANPALYREKSAQENRIWGRLFSDPERARRVKEDQEAAQSLRIHRDQPGLVALLRKHGYQPVKGLSLACGNGRAERGLMEKGICREFHGIDIAADALEVAREEARKAGLNIRYEQGDLNDLQLPEDAYDLVVTQNCLHHVLRLEHLAEQIHRSLRPGGVLWIHDYIGETQFQYTDARLDLVNAILAVLPEEYRSSTLSGRRVDRVERREPGTLASPFEAIRSADIMPVFLRWFGIVEKYEWDSFLRLVCPQGTRAAFARSEESRALFELLFLFDRYLVKSGVLPPAAGAYLLAPLEAGERQAS